MTATTPGDTDLPLHDVLIVGGGLVGASLAIALDGLGLDVGLVEASGGDALPEVFDQRNLSLAEATVNALDALGVLRHLRAPMGAIRRIHVSRRGDFGRVLLDAADYGRTEFGRVVVARDFGAALEARLAELPALRRYRGARFEQLDVGDASMCSIRVAAPAGPRQLRTRLLVGADGASSAVRDALGIAATRHDYAQTLFVARVRGAQAPDGTAYHRLGPPGPPALPPRGDRHFGLIHAVAAEEADAVAALDDAAFLARAQEAIGWRAGRLVECGPRSAYPLVGVRAQALHAGRGVIVGNAAQSLHPIGAQGFNLGARDALTLAELIADAVAAGNRDCGDAGLLARYAQRRMPDREDTFRFTDNLLRQTTATGAVRGALRSVGLLALDHSHSLKAQLVAGAMGYRGDVPRLCRAAR